MQESVVVVLPVNYVQRVIVFKQQQKQQLEKNCNKYL